MFETQFMFGVGLTKKLQHFAIVTASQCSPPANALVLLYSREIHKNAITFNSPYRSLL